MFKIFQCIVFVIASLAFSESLFVLKQVNPVRQAPTTINEAGWNTEYPWFSTDGKLFLFTREVPNSEIQRVHVSYIKNRDDVADTPPNQTLPALIVATPKELVPINNKVAPSETIKAIAVCEETAQPQSLTGKWRYLFTLYAAIGPGGVGTEKKIYRAHRINVVVSKTTGEILSMGMAGAYEPATGTDAAGHNETEPMLTRDGRYLFWASSVFYGTIARFIGPVTACTQLLQTSKPYSLLPADEFEFVDQYTTGTTQERTSRTNYHTVVERLDGKKALIFETCYGQVELEQSSCPPGNVPYYRDCQCGKYVDQLMSTGFEPNGEPDEIENCCSAPLNGTQRVTHPAISGPQRAQDGSWLLFFMRGKKIWYTKITE